VKDIRALLKKHRASATFFVCSDYLDGVEDEARALLEDGCELGNHCPKDREYASFEPEEFEEALVRTNDALTAIQGKRPKWFRAPQGRYTGSMRECVIKHEMRHALADSFTGDWEIPDPNYIANSLLYQASHGSIIVIHTPERGFREHCLEALKLVLEGLEQRGFRVLTLTQLDELAQLMPSKEE